MRALLSLSLAFVCASAHAGGVYFSDRQGSVRVIDFGSATARTLGSATDPRGIVFDPVTERVYYADRGGSGSLNSYAAAGSGFATHLTNLPSVADLRPDRVNRIFYWCQETGGLIRKAPFTASGDAAVVGTTVFSGLTSPYYLDLDLAGGRIFWSQNGVGLFSGPLAGGTATNIYSGGNSNRGIAAETASGFLYWNQRGNPGVYRRLIAGGAVQTVYGSGSITNTILNTPHGLILDIPANKLYWADTGTNNSGSDTAGVYRGDFDGSTLREVVFGGPPNPNQTWDIDLDTRTPNYTEWKARFFRFDAPAALTDKTADADTDGDSNLAEYAFGTGPLNGQSRLVLEPVRVVDGSAEYGAVRFRRRAGATDLTYRVQVSTSLVSWPDNSTTPGTTVQHGAPVPAEDGMEVVTIRSTAPANSEIRQFIRVQVTSP